MLRPRTPRRQAVLTVRALEEIRTEMPEVEIRTFGCTDEELARAEINTHWEHQGPLLRSEVSLLLRDSDVFLDASVYQAFGRTGLEAMACGCVPVLPWHGGIREFARDGENALLADTHSSDGPRDACCGSRGMRTSTKGYRPLESRPR